MQIGAGNFTVWLRLSDGKWYSPKDISGLPRAIGNLATCAHLRESTYRDGIFPALEGSSAS